MSVSEPAASAAFPRAWMVRGSRGDARLARLATRGDSRAFEAIFERYHQELYRYCRAILGDAEEAQDALQGTMASALRSLPGDGREIALRPWLYRVAHNEAISILRHRATHWDSERLSEQQVAPGADSEAEARERLRDLVADLDALPDRQRGALVMRELSGLSYAQIGAALASSAGAARQAVYEARVALQELKAGREMECEGVRRALSERDGRVLRGRRLRAHLRACETCRDFHTGISRRRSDLQALSPPLPALAASGLLTTILGQAGAGGAGAGAAVGGGAGVAGMAGTGIAGSAAVKGASLVAAVVVGAGAMDVTGAVHVPVVDGLRASGPSHSAPAAQPAAGHHGVTASGQVKSGGESASNALAPAPGSAGERERSQEQGGAASQAGQDGSSASTTHGKPPANAVGGLPSQAQGTPPAHSMAGGRSHGNAPASPPGHANSAGHAHTPPPQSHGKPGSPPGHDPASGHGSSGQDSPAHGSAGGSAAHGSDGHASGGKGSASHGSAAGGSNNPK